MLSEIIATPKFIFHILQGMLVAQAKSARQFIQFKTITQIGGEDIVAMLVVRRMIAIENALLIAVILRGVVAQDIFQSCFQSMDLGKGCGVIYLESMFRRILTAIVTLVFQALKEVLPTVGSLHV